MATCKDCLHAEVCYYKTFNDVRSLENRRNDVEKICKSFLGETESKRGRWVQFHSEAAGDIQYCSACDVGFAHRTDFCPHCGADMREVDDD